MSGKLALVLFVLFLPSLLHAEVASHGMVVSGTLEVEGAVETGGGGAQKLESILEPRLEGRLPGGFALTAIVRLRGDPWDELEPGSPDQHELARSTRRLRLGDHGDVELREIYLARSLFGGFLTIGKQQVVWGQADGLKVLDVVDPQDFREFILDSFEDSRIPLWTVNFETRLPVGALQLLWIPDPTVHDIPEIGSAYELTARTLVPRPPPGVEIEFGDLRAPRRIIADSDAGMRWAGTFDGLDVSLCYLYRTDDVPVLYRTIEVDLVDLVILDPEVTVEPSYERSHLAGGTFSTVFGSLVIRGEAGVSVGRFYSTDDITDRDGVVRANEVATVLGFDWQGFRDTFLSLQIFQSTISHREPQMLRDRVQWNATAFARRQLWNETLTAQAIWLQGLDFFDGLVRPRLAYRLADELLVWAGADVFYGSGAGAFGQFSARDRIVTGVELSL